MKTLFEQQGGTYTRQGDYLLPDIKPHLAEVEQQAQEMFFRLVDEMAKQEGVTEQLKATDQMEWVRRMNNIRNRATEIVNDEIICV